MSATMGLDMGVRFKRQAARLRRERLGSGIAARAAARLASRCCGEMFRPFGAHERQVA